MSLTIKRILAIIDPTSDRQRALIRAVLIARRAQASVHAYVCCHSTARCDDTEALRRAEVARHEAWLARVIAGIDMTGGVAITSEVEWHDDWRERLLAAATRNQCDLIVKSTYRHSPARRRLIKTSDWVLLRGANCPVLLIKRDAPAPGRRVLIAVNLGVEEEQHQHLNEDVVDMAHQLIAGRDDFELHAVSAYAGHDRFIHPPELAERVGIPIERAHCAAGDPDQVIADCAGRLEAELVIIGTVSRSGLVGLTAGNTAERILDRVDTDMLVAIARH